MKRSAYNDIKDNRITSYDASLKCYETKSIESKWYKHVLANKKFFLMFSHLT